MTLMAKRTRKGYQGPGHKTTVMTVDSSENSKVIWLFDRIDRAGPFAFDTNRPDFQHKEFLDKMISYSSMTWREVRMQTHDGGRSKHHFLSDTDRFSREARERIAEMNLGEETDRIFSFALQNRLRIVGLRERELFHVLWYDPEHRVYPSERR